MSKSEICRITEHYHDYNRITKDVYIGDAKRKNFHKKFVLKKQIRIRVGRILIL